MNWSQQPSRNYQVLYRGPCFSFFLFDRKKSDHAIKRRKREKKKMSSSSGQMVHCLPPNDPHQDWVRRLCRVRGCGADRSRRRRRRRRHPTVSGGFLLAHGYRQSTSTLISPSAIGSPPPSLFISLHFLRLWHPNWMANPHGRNTTIRRLFPRLSLQRIDIQMENQNMKKRRERTGNTNHQGQKCQGMAG